MNCVSEDEGTDVAPPRELTPESGRIISQFQVRLPGLDEVVTHLFYTDPSGFIHKRTLGADGEEVRLRELMEQERLASRAKFGRLTPGTHQWLSEQPPDTIVEVGVVFDPELDEARITRLEHTLRQEERLRGIALRRGTLRTDEAGQLIASSESSESAQALARAATRPLLEAELTQLIDDVVRMRAIEVTSALRSRGFAITEVESTTPIVYAEVRAQDALALAQEPEVSWLFSSEASGFELAAPSGISFHKIDIAMNASPQNLDGTGQRVGLIENARCAIHDKHDAFKLAPATAYNNASVIKSCAVDADCATFCKTLSGDAPGLCRQLKSGVMRCVDPHLSQVAGGIWSTRFEAGAYKNYGAGKATPYVWVGSNTSATNTACVPSQTQLAYDWFNSNNVKTVVGSYGCSPTQGGSSVDAFIEDWNAARRNVAIFKAAPSYDTTEDGCRAANAICVGGMTKTNPIPTGEGWKNSLDSSQLYFLDREKPDLVALSGDRSPGPGIDIIKLSGTNAWETGYGTSFANPLVADLATLVRQKCGGTLDARYLRALLMAGSWYYDPEPVGAGGLAYSTQPKPGGTVDNSLPGYIDPSGVPPFGKDYSDGAGGPTGDNLLGWCGAGPAGVTFDGGPLTLSSQGGVSFTPGSQQTGPIYNLTEPDGDSGAVLLSYDTSNLYEAWSKSYTLAANTRLRAVLTWDKCTPTLASGPGSGPYNVQSVSEDFDLFLCNASSCAAQSRSVFDNKEGFDITIPTAGSYRLIAIYDADASYGCNGSFTHAAGFAVAYGAASSFIEAP